jgi:hypothetical protein
MQPIKKQVEKRYQAHPHFCLVNHGQVGIEGGKDGAKNWHTNESGHPQQTMRQQQTMQTVNDFIGIIATIRVGIIFF